MPVEAFKLGEKIGIGKIRIHHPHGIGTVESRQHGIFSVANSLEMSGRHKTGHAYQSKVFHVKIFGKYTGYFFNARVLSSRGRFFFFGAAREAAKRQRRNSQSFNALWRMPSHGTQNFAPLPRPVRGLSVRASKGSPPSNS